MVSNSDGEVKKWPMFPVERYRRLLPRHINRTLIIPFVFI